MLWGTLIPKMGAAGEFESFFNDERRADILRAIVDGYYRKADTPVILDTNRTWTSKLALLDRVYPDSKVICCVRDVGSIIDSIERILRKNPLLTSRVLKFQPGSSVYARVETLMNSDSGLVGLPWSCLREAWFSNLASKLVVVEYDKLCREPRNVMQSLYTELGEAPFAHDFESVVFDEPEYDADLGMPGLHKVRTRVEPNTSAPVIPPDIFAKYADTSFWRRAEHRRGAKII